MENKELSDKISSLEIALLLLINSLRNTAEVISYREKNEAKTYKVMLEIPENLLENIEKLIIKT